MCESASDLRGVAFLWARQVRTSGWGKKQFPCHSFSEQTPFQDRKNEGRNRAGIQKSSGEHKRAKQMSLRRTRREQSGKSEAWGPRQGKAQPLRDRHRGPPPAAQQRPGQRRHLLLPGPPLLFALLSPRVRAEALTRPQHVKVVSGVAEGVALGWKGRESRCHKRRRGQSLTGVEVHWERC